MRKFENWFFRVLYYMIMIPMILLAFPLWPILGLNWWLNKSIARDRQERAEKAFADAQAFEPAPQYQSAHFVTEAELGAAGYLNGKGTPLGYTQESGRMISMPPNADPVHRIVFGQTGSGKSSSAIMPELLTWPHGMIVADGTGELATTTAHHRRKYGRVVIVNSTNQFQKELAGLEQGGFNVIARNWVNPDEPDTFAIHAQKEAWGIVRRDPNQRDFYWADTTRELTTNGIMTECMYNPKPNIVNVANVMLGDINKYAADMVATGDPFLQKLWGRWGRPGAQEIKSLNEVQENARTEFWPFTMVPRVAQCLTQDDVDFRRCVFENMTIYLVGSMETVKQTSRFLRVGVSHATAQIMSVSGQGNNPCKLVIDEGFQLGAIDDLDSNMAATRKFGLFVLYCLTEHQQLTTLFPGTYDSVMGACGVRQWINAPDATTSEYVSGLCGEREVLTVSRSVNTNPIDRAEKLGVSDSKSISTRRLILPHELRSLKRNEQILWVPNISNPIRCNKKTVLEIPELAKLARPNPFYQKRRA